MFNIRNFFYGLFIALIATLLVWSYIQNNKIGELLEHNKNLTTDLKEVKENNESLKLEIDRVLEITKKHHDITEETIKENEKIKDDINIYNEIYMDWFNTECPSEFNDIFCKVKE